MLRLALYGHALYGYYGGGAIAARRLGYVQVGYAVGLIDDAMNGALAESIADRRAIVMQAIGRNLRRPDHATAQVLNEIVRGRAIALTGAIADDGPRRGRQCDIGVLVAK